MSTVRLPFKCARKSGLHNQANNQTLPAPMSRQRCQSLYTLSQRYWPSVTYRFSDTQIRSFSSSTPSQVSFFKRLGIFSKRDTDDGERKTDHIPVSVTEAIQGKSSAANDEKLKKAQTMQQTPTQGDLSSSSIFNEELETTVAKSEEAAMVKDSNNPEMFRTWLENKHETRKNILENAGLYPNEYTFLRNVRLRQIRRRGRLTKKEIIAQTERSHVAKSHMIKTSVKKLGPLARQIQGKTLEYAMTQMRFSVKKASKSVLSHLEQAKAEAVVTKGFDAKKTYIEQAWVGRGTFAKEIEFRARGRVNLLNLPYTSISVVLKEEPTRQRVKKEREERIARRKLWVPLPNRPIYGQHQYYTW